MLVFVDESGDTGLRNLDGSSRYFVITLVLFDTQEAAEEVSQKIDALRQELSLPAQYEFHFFKTKDVLRRAFLTAVRQGQFIFCSLGVDKRKLHGTEFDHRDLFYKTVCEAAFSQARPLLHEANVQFDESGSKAFRQSLASHLLRSINDGEPGMKRIKKVKAQNSKGNNLMQLADMLCGAVARSYHEENGENEFRRLVSTREEMGPSVAWLK